MVDRLGQTISLTTYKNFLLDPVYASRTLIAKVTRQLESGSGREHHNEVVQAITNIKAAITELEASRTVFFQQLPFGDRKRRESDKLKVMYQQLLSLSEGVRHAAIRNSTATPNRKNIDE